MNNILKQLYGKIDTVAYDKIKNGLMVSGLGVAFANYKLFVDRPEISGPINASVYALMGASLLMEFLNGKKYTKDTNEVRKLYYEFITNYNKLNKTFDLNDPVEIYTMYNYLLYRGYLSSGKEFKFSNDKTRDITTLNGADIITGTGVCRHISSALTDILNDYGIDAGTLCVQCTPINVDIRILSEPKCSKEELVEWVKDNINERDKYEAIMRIIDKVVDEEHGGIEIKELPVEEDFAAKLGKIIGNHAINYAYKDGKSYFLDPTNTRTYRMYESNKILYIKEEKLPIKQIAGIRLNSTEQFIRMNKQISKHYPSISMEQEKAMFNNVLDMCENNIDVFENFYNENSELYDEITNKVLKFKKPKSILIKN